MKRLTFRLLFCFMLIIMILALGAACAKTESTPTTSKPVATTSAPAPTATASKYGGTLRLLTPNVMQPISPGWPAEMTEMDFSLSMACLDRLLSGDAQGNPLPMLSTAWKVADDKKSITFTLRQGVKFHDGTDFDAQAAKFNLDAVIAAKVSQTDLWKSVDVVDDYTIRLNLNEFQNTIWPALASWPGYMVSPTAYQKNGKDWMKMNPVGTGPFKFKSWERDVSLKFVKNPDYWQKGKPYLDGVEYPFFANETAGSIAMKAGDAEMMTFMEIPVATDMKANGFDVLYIPDGCDVFNPDSANPNSPFADKRVRQAAEYAIDKAGIVKSIGAGFQIVADQVALPGNVGYNANWAPRTYDPAKAKQLLADAGYAQGFKTQILASPDANPTYLSAVQANLKAVGIDASIVMEDFAVHTQKQTKGWEGLFRVPWNSFPNFNQMLWMRVMTSTQKLASLTHPAGLEDAIIDSITSTTIDPQKVQKATKIVFDDATVIPVYGYSVGKISKKTVHDTNFKLLGFEIWTPEDAWISK